MEWPKSWALTLASTALWIALGWGVFLAAFDDNGFRVTESAALAVDGTRRSKFAPGGTFIAHRTICVDKVVPGDFAIEVHSADGGMVMTLNRGRLGQVPTGCTTRNVLTTVPPGLMPGKYRLRAFLVHEINFLRSVRRELPPIEFEVSKERP